MRVGIIGGAGYTAGELLRLLLNHPDAEIVFVNSQSHASQPVTSVHSGLIGETDLCFTDQMDLNSIDCLFLCQGHGKSREFWQNNQMPESLRVIDMAQDFRDESEGYVYGLPEINADRIASAMKIANPGCFATAIELSLLPLAWAGLLNGEINITGVTGSTGAGVKPGATTHFSWRSDNLSVYKAFRHQHLIEIKATLSKLQPEAELNINFVPMRGDFPRGIFVVMHTDCPLTNDEAVELYSRFYSTATFTHLTNPQGLDLKQVVNTNKALLHVEVIDGKILVTAAIDNLLKGASGQAVQNMNILFGLRPDSGLHLKPSAF